MFTRTKPVTQQQHTDQRNFVLQIANGVLIAISEAMTDISLITTALLSQLTQSSLLIGLLAPLRETGWFLPQLFISNLAERLPRKVVLYQFATVFRVGGWVALAVCLLLLRDKTWLLWAFFGCTVVISLAGGVGGIGYLTVTAKTVANDKRGQLFGLRELIGGGLSVLMGGVSVLILSGSLSFPQNYGVLFAISTFFFAGGCIAFGLVSEQPDAIPKTTTPLMQQLRRAANIARTDANFRRFIFTRMAVLFARSGVPFITVFAKRDMHVSDAFIGTMVSVTLASSLLSGLAWGKLNDTRGSRMVLVLSCILCAVQFGLGIGLLPTHSVTLLVASFIVGGVGAAGFNISFVPLLLSVIPNDQRPIYIGLSNTTLGVVMLLTSLIGLIADYAGFAALFAFCIVCFGIALERVSRIKQVASG